MITTCGAARPGGSASIPGLRRCGFFVALLAIVSAYTPSAEAQRASREPYVGLWPDIALSLGGGIGIGHAIDTNVYASARIGALFMFEPWVLNIGFSGEVGALPRRGLGAEVELNYLRGPFLQLGYDRIVGGDFMTRVTLGFALFGVQWQHRLASTTPDNALLFVLRLPLGIGWFVLNEEAQRRREGRRRPPPVAPSE